MLQVVEESATCNRAQLVVDSDGGVVVPTYDWASFFTPIFRKLPQVKVTYHFHVRSGVVATKQHSDEMPAEIRTSAAVVPDQDITCPEPSAPRPDSRHLTPEPTSPSHPSTPCQEAQTLWTVWPTWPQQEELHSSTS